MLSRSMPCGAPWRIVSRGCMMSRADQARGFGLRLLEASDSIRELTALLHRAYRPLAERGFR